MALVGSCIIPLAGATQEILVFRSLFKVAEHEQGPPEPCMQQLPGSCVDLCVCVDLNSAFRSAVEVIKCSACIAPSCPC